MFRMLIAFLFAFFHHVIILIYLIVLGIAFFGTILAETAIWKVQFRSSSISVQNIDHPIICDNNS